MQVIVNNKDSPASKTWNSSVTLTNFQNISAVSSSYVVGLYVRDVFLPSDELVLPQILEITPEKLNFKLNSFCYLWKYH